MFLVPLVRSALPERWRDRQRITAIPNAVDTERFHPGDRRAEKARLGLDPDVPLILMLANLAPHKGQETAIGAAAELARRGIRHRLWMAGSERRSDSYTRRLRQIIAEAGVGSSVDLLGQRDDAPDLLRAADVLILPSSREGLPLCILEAQASRVPVLAAPVSGVPEIIQDGETGFLVPAGDARGYADRLELLLGRREIQERIADQAFRRIRDQHGWTAYLRAVIAEYEGLEDGSHGP
jgi:glycosyltransferase involved in cell wall biosynthesis